MKNYLLLSGVLIGYAAFLFAPIDQAVAAHWQYTPDTALDIDHAATHTPHTGILLTNTPNWQQAQQCAWHRGIRCAHFGIHANDAIGSDLGVDLFIATRARKNAGQHNIKISIMQEARGSSVTVFDMNGGVITGELPCITSTRETHHVPLLPWRDGMTIYYSVLLQTIEGRPYVAVVQHTRSVAVPNGQEHKPSSIAHMLSEYATYPVLQDRLHGFLDEVKHMRVIPLPYAHEKYQFPLAEELFVSWAATKGTVRVMPRVSATP